jgi:CRP-like cAMP-binding protein
VYPRTRKTISSLKNPPWAGKAGLCTSKAACEVLLASKLSTAVLNRNRAVVNQAVQFLHPEERTDSAGNAIRNRLLSAIPQNEFRHFRNYLEFVSLPQRQVLHQPHQPLEFAYFLNSGLISLVVVLTGGKTVETGIVGREGFVGIPSIAGLSRSPLLEVMQISGDGFRVPVASLQEALWPVPELRGLLLRHAVILGLHVAQTAACNRLHGVEQRLARWLLMAEDRVDSEILPITHDFLATMLGTDRPSVTLAARVLQKNQIIEYNRGSVKILNRAELEKVSCECYGVIRQYSDVRQSSVPLTHP